MTADSLTLDLPDGRSLFVRVHGPADGRVLLYHFGTPVGSHQDQFLQRATAERGLRLVSYARPGYESSTRHPGRSVADVAADTAAVLDHLGAERCLVAGWSGGGPHALACAALLPDRVDAALVVAGVAPYDAEGLDFLAGMGQDNLDEFGAALEGEEALREYLVPAGAELADIEPGAIVEAMASLLPDVDRAQITGEFGEDAAEAFHAAMSTGIDGWLDDDLAFARPWGFDLAAIRCPVHVWQGSEDLMVPAAHGRWLAEHIPTAVAHLEDGEGHLSIGIGAVDRMLDGLLAP